MKANELRLGNLVEYYITDNTDERKEWWEVTKIDVHDLESLSQTNDPDYRPIPLTEDWLLRAGFERSGRYYKNHNWGYRYSIGYSKITDRWNVSIMAAGIFSSIKYAHQLQNLVFALTGDELTFAENHTPCDSDDPDDICENCNCWKSTRRNCS